MAAAKKSASSASSKKKVVGSTAKGSAPKRSAPKNAARKAAKASPTPTTSPATSPATSPPKPASRRATGRRATALHDASTPLVLGIDVGGSGIKGAPVDLVEGVLAADRLRIETPQPSTPEACAAVIAQIVKNFEHMTGRQGPVGCTFPGVVWDGVTHTAANVDEAWLGADADALFERVTGREFTVINDAQAAVLAECYHGAATGVDGMVLMITFGTGIGSGLAYRGVALPGVELGHLRMHGVDAETLASANVKEKEKLSWKDWAERVNDYLRRVETILWPELIIVGGGVSERADKFLPLLKSRAPIVPAKLVNGAGIVGAAIAAARQPNVRRR